MDHPFRRERRPAFTLIELLVVIAIIAVLIALLLPAVQSAREAARRAQCINNLMQLSIAIQNYESAHEVLPPGVVNDTGPIQSVARGYHFSWLAQLLPFVEQKNVFRHLDFSSSAYSGSNLSARVIAISTFLCPSDARPPASDTGATSNYVACHNGTEAPIAADNNGVFFLNSHIRYDDITDGTAQTIFLGEKLLSPSDLGWVSGTRATLRNTGRMLPTTPTGAGVFAPVGDDESTTPPASGKETANPNLLVGGFSSRHAGGSNFAFGDGSVRFLKGSINAKIFRCLGNRADGEMISADEY